MAIFSVETRSGGYSLFAPVQNIPESAIFPDTEKVMAGQFGARLGGTAQAAEEDRELRQ